MFPSNLKDSGSETGTRKKETECFALDDDDENISDDDFDDEWDVEASCLTAAKPVNVP